jgi:hypothetical protein
VEKCLAKLSEGKNHVRGEYDYDLTQPWKEVQEMAEHQAAAGFPYFRDVVIPSIVNHVEKIRAEHRLAMMVQGFTQKPIQERQDILRSLSLKFTRYANSPPEGCKLRDYLSREAALTACVSYGACWCFHTSSRSRFPTPPASAMKQLRISHELQHTSTTSPQRANLPDSHTTSACANYALSKPKPPGIPKPSAGYSTTT